MFNWYLFLFILFGLAVLLRAEFIVSVLYIFAGILLLARPWIGRVMQGIQCQRQFVDRAFLGETVEVRLDVTNTSRLPVPWLNVQENVPLELRVPNFLKFSMSLLPGERKSFTYQLICTRRGYYGLGPLGLYAGDLFGLAEQGVMVDRPDFLIVYPQVLPLNRLGLPSRSPFGTLPAHDRIFEDPARPAGVRDYVAGDTLRRIDWKTSANVGKLQVRRYQPAIALEVGLLLNLDPGDYSRENTIAAAEWAIVIAASLAAHWIGQRQPVGLATNGRDGVVVESGMADQDSLGLGWQVLPPGKTRAHLMRILELLARVETGEHPDRPARPFAPVLEQGTLDLAWGATAVIITSRETEGLLANLLHLQRRGLQVLVVLVDPLADANTTQARAEHLGIPVHHVWDEKEFDVWRARS